MPGHEATRSREQETAYVRSLPATEIVGMLDHLSDGIVVLGEDWRYRYLNGPAAEMLGRRREDLLGRNVWDVFPEGVGHPFHRAYEQAMGDRLPQRISQYYAPLDRWFENRIYPLGDSLLILFHDTTEEVRIHEEVREYAERMEEAERIAHFGVWKWEIASGTVLWSRELHRIYGLNEGEFGGTVDDFLSYLHPGDHERVGFAIERAITTLEPFEFEERIIRPSGEERILFSQGRAIAGRDGEAEALVGVCHDVTERLAAKRALDVSERRTRAIINNLPSLVAVKDHDGRYLMANEEFAELVSLPGDAVIGSECEALFSEEVATRFRANDERAAEHGKPVYDEVVLTRDGERRTFSTVTFALPGDDGSPGETCTIATDVTDRPERESERKERLRWERVIRSAREEDRMSVVGQPVVDLATGKPSSWELLVRIAAADSGSLIAAADFVPAAERFGLIQDIDVWMVGQALRLAETRAVEVNLSAVTLADAKARGRILELLATKSLDAQRIVFEITETVAADHIDTVCEFAGSVTDLGCGLALDDFGTGFGSFTYLHRLPLRYLKVDRSFVSGLADSRDNQRIVSTIIGIAEQFGLDTIVEGVEDEATLEAVRGLGADFVQGYHLGRPGPLETP